MLKHFDFIMCYLNVMISAKGLKSQLHILLYFGGPFLAVFLSLSSSVKIVVKNIPENIFLPL